MANPAVLSRRRAQQNGAATHSPPAHGRVHRTDHRDVGRETAKARIQALDRSHLAQVKALLDANLPEWGGDESLLAATLIDYPWADPRTPSLVAVDREDRVVGFLGMQVKRMRLGERTFSGACASHFVVAPDFRRTGTGAAMMQTVLAGPQSVTWTDCANERVVQMGRMVGGHIDHVRACDWLIVLRPLRWSAAVAAATFRKRLSRSDLPVAAFPFQAAFPAILHGRYPRPESGVTGEDADAALIAANLPELNRGFELRVDYSEEYLLHLFAQVRTVHGKLTTRLVRSNGQPIGWYAYVPQRSGVIRLLHLTASPEHVEEVFGEFTQYARLRGARALSGRVEPHLRPALRNRYAALGYARQPMVHNRDPEIRGLLSSASSLFTQLDAEWFVT